jgi:hypothetical protein
MALLSFPKIMLPSAPHDPPKASATSVRTCTPARDGNFLQLSFGKKTEPAAVRRPKRTLGVFRPRQWAGGHLVNGAQPDHGIGTG